MKFTGEQLKGLEKPPLVNGKWDKQVWWQWATVNKKHPWLMLYADWKKHCEPMKTKDYSLYLSELEYWFRSIEYRLEEGEILEDIIYSDYLARSD